MTFGLMIREANCDREAKVNCYKMEYERQHPRKDATQAVLKIVSVIIAIVIVAAVARFDARANIAPAIIYPDITGKAAEVGIAPGVSVYVPGANCDELSTQNDAEQDKTSKQADAGGGKDNATQQQVSTNIIKPQQISTNSAKQHEAAGTEAAAGSATHEYSSITISDSEMEELKAIVAAEAQTQSMEGREAVVEVIFNRVLSPEFPNTVHGVLSQKGQFATWKMRNASWVVPDAAVAPIEWVLEHGRTVLPDTSYVYFDTKGVNGRKHIKIGAHYFGR